MQVYGNTNGLASSDRKALERLYRRRVSFDVLATPELGRALADISRSTGRQVGTLIHRSGQIEYVVVGDATKLMLPDIGRLRGAAGRFRGLRLVHTHLRNEPLSRDDLVDLTRLRLDLVAALCISQDGRPLTVHYAHCVPENALQRSGQEPRHSSATDASEPFRVYGPVPFGKVECNPRELVAALEEEFARAARTRVTTAKDGRAIIVHVSTKRAAHLSQGCVDELRELAQTAGLDVVDTIVQLRDRVDPKYVLGRGKLEDVVLRAMQLDVEVLLFDGDLSATQSASIGRVTDLKVIDRTQVILDIFAQHAQSRDGQLQVELAQMRYLLPRLGARDDSLSRLTGGIGGRGPGETKLEVGRRRARERITQLEGRLKRLSRQRRQRRARRDRAGVLAVAVVGYTNAGKSTLINALTQSDLLTADKLFATLDTRSRRLHVGVEQPLVITDTVGFIRDLPRDLLAAFRATFEEAADAHLLLHVVDVSDPSREQHLSAAEKLLEELDLEQIPRLIVFNKADRMLWTSAEAIAHRGRGIAVSAHDPSTLAPLLEGLRQRLCPEQNATTPGLSGSFALAP